MRALAPPSIPLLLSSARSEQSWTGLLLARRVRRRRPMRVSLQLRLPSQTPLRLLRGGKMRLQRASGLWQPGRLTPSQRLKLKRPS
jgi:hypothetical protein